MRKETDICLLCQINPATKTNSHILPRFISTDFLGPKGKPRRGFDLSGEDFENGKKRVIQDSPKEDYILCDECESYFSVLESISAPTFKSWREKVEAGEFTEDKIKDYLSIVICNTSNPIVLRLLVYSMFWRASISSHKLFDDYKLSAPLEESLRMALLSVKSLSPAELMGKLEKTKIPIHPYACISSKTFKDGTANVLAAINCGNPASLHVDRFGFLLFERKEDITDPIFSNFGNINEGDRMIMIMAEQLWEELMVKKPLSMVAEEVKARRKA